MVQNINLVKQISFLFITFIITIFSSSNSYTEEICDSFVIDNLNKNIINQEYDPVVEYNEIRNDSGIFFDHQWNEKEQKIVIKRNKNNFPIIKFSLFELDKFKLGKSAIKFFNGADLSKLNDYEIIELIKKTGFNSIILDNDKLVNIKSKKYFLNNFKLRHFDLKSINNIDTTKGVLEISFDSLLSNERNDIWELLDDNFQNEFQGFHPICDKIRTRLNWPIETLTYDEFKYDADVREGLKNKELLVTSVFNLYNDNGIIKSIRSEKGVASFRQFFDFKKFPFDKQKLIIRLKTNVGNWRNFNNKDFSTIGSVNFIIPEPSVYLNLNRFTDSKVNKLKAWSIPENGIEIKNNTIINNNFFDQDLNKVVTRTESVLDIVITIERNFQHYLLKIMLPVFLILCVAWYVLWIPTEKYEARLNTSIIALLALIAYNFVFQDDIPKLEYLTDLDWFILLSYIFCLIPVFLSIGFSKFIATNQKKIMKINKLIKIWGGLLYLILTLQIFYPVI